MENVMLDTGQLDYFKHELEELAEAFEQAKRFQNYPVFYEEYTNSLYVEIYRIKNEYKIALENTD